MKIAGSRSIYSICNNLGEGSPNESWGDRRAVTNGQNRKMVGCKRQSNTTAQTKTSATTRGEKVARGTDTRVVRVCAYSRRLFFWPNGRSRAKNDNHTRGTWGRQTTMGIDKFRVAKLLHRIRRSIWKEKIGPIGHWGKTHVSGRIGQCVVNISSQAIGSSTIQGRHGRRKT